MSAVATAPVERATGPALTLENVSVRFRTEDGYIQAVDSASLDVRPGEVLAVVGESGCGKSVTSMAVLGLLPPSSEVTGRIMLGETNLLALSEKEKRQVRGKDVAMIFQEPMTSLNPVFTVGRQVSEVLRRHFGMSRQQAGARAKELLALVGIPEPERRLDEYPHQLSGGLRQRVMIAIAVACDPKVLIADEPTTALDVTVQAGILDLLRDLRDRLGTAIILITHDLGVVADIADRVVVMYAGRVVETGPIDRLFAAPQHPYTNGLLAAVPHPERRSEEGRLREIPGRVPVLTEPWGNCAFNPRCPRATEQCRTERPKLEPVNPLQRVACFHPGPDEAVEQAGVSGETKRRGGVR